MSVKMMRSRLAAVNEALNKIKHRRSRNDAKEALDGTLDCAHRDEAWEKSVSQSKHIS
jgi:hypothetical protein